MTSRPVKRAAYCAACALLALAVAGRAAELPRMHPQAWPRAARAIPPDAALEAKISALLARMTPQQKVGQLIQADIGSITPRTWERTPLGLDPRSGRSAPDNDKRATAESWLKLADRFYAAC